MGVGTGHGSGVGVGAGCGMGVDVVCGVSLRLGRVGAALPSTLY